MKAINSKYTGRKSKRGAKRKQRAQAHEFCDQFTRAAGSVADSVQDCVTPEEFLRLEARAECTRPELTVYLKVKPLKERGYTATAK
jgi:hypothetical protein